MKLSIVIPAYNEENYIGETLNSVIKNASSDLLEILVVNNASTDNTALVAGRYEMVRVVNEPQKGLTRARQAGLMAASGELVAFIDADTQVSKQWFEVLQKEFSSNNSLVCLSGPYKYFGFDTGGHRIVELWYNFWLKVWHWFIDRITATEKGYVIMGGNFVAKKEALIKAGGFDEKIKFYGEDTDIARRLSLVGKVKFSKDFWGLTSARRFNGEGLIFTAVKYLLNYLSIVIFKKPVTSRYKDIR